MAEKRMFAKTIIDSDAFIDMPLSTQALYFHLAMRADDDGFINNPKKIQRMIGASDDDAKVLIMKKFLIPFESGVVVIKHWKIHNYIQRDRYKETVYLQEKAQLAIKENKAYTLSEEPMYPECIQDVSTMEAQIRLDKIRLDKNSIDIYSVPETDTQPAPVEPEKPKSKRFVKPTVEEVEAYCTSRGNTVNAQRFIDHYESNGWKVGKNPMKDWKAAVRTWESREEVQSSGKHSGSVKGAEPGKPGALGTYI